MSLHIPPATILIIPPLLVIPPPTTSAPRDITLSAAGSAISGYDFSGYITIDGSYATGSGKGLGNTGSYITIADNYGVYANFCSWKSGSIQMCRFTVNGTISCYSLTQTSDVTTKTNIVTLANALDNICQLRGVSYTSILDNSESIGVIAQEVELVIPQVVSTDENGIKGVAYTNLIGYLIESIKELNTKVENLTNRIIELESKKIV